MADPKAGFDTLNSGDPWTGLASKVWGAGFIVVILAVANSAIANSNAGANAATRVGFALARIGLLPRVLASIHPTHRTPYVAVNVQAAGGIVLAVALGFATGGPLNAFALLGTVATIIIVSIYILINVSNIAFYWRERRGEFNPFFNLAVPVVGTLIFLPALLAAFGIDFAGLGISPLAPPSNAAPWIIGAWMLIGILVLVYLSQRAPERIEQTGTVFVQN
jgi:amino acid transporter